MTALVASDASTEAEADKLASAEAALFSITLLVEAEVEVDALPLADSEPLCEPDMLVLTESDARLLWDSLAARDRASLSDADWLS